MNSDHSELDALLRHPQLDCLDYWTNLPTDVEIMIAPGGQDAGYLITHESETHELCLVTGANRTFVRDKRNGASVDRLMSPNLCRKIEIYFNEKERGENSE